VIRAFIAVELPESVRREVSQLQARFKATGADAKWVEADNLHLTLKFLGNIEESQVEPLKAALASAAQRVSPFTIQVEGIGAFPKTTSPRVVWVGISQGEEALIQLAQAVEEACVGLSFPKEERPFRGHLTIGRVRSRERLAGLIRELQVEEFKASTTASTTQVVLFQSVLSPKGPIYTPLAEIPLTQ